MTFHMTRRQTIYIGRNCDDDNEKDQKYCRIFMNDAICHCLKDNGQKNNFKDNFSELQDKIRQKYSGSVLDERMMVGFLMHDSGNLMRYYMFSTTA